MYTDSYETNLELLSVVLPIWPVGKYRKSEDSSPPNFGQKILCKDSGSNCFTLLELVRVNYARRIGLPHTPT